MKIIVYTISDCQFSQQEKDYLKTHNLPYEERNLESNKEFLTEMLAVSNNFAGTPVTKIEKDDGQITVLKGFTEVEFSQALGLAPVNPTPTPPPPPASEQKSVPEVQIPSSQDVPAAPVSNPTPPPAPVAETPPAAPTTPHDDQLNSLLNDLQTKAQDNTVSAAPATTSSVAPSANMPSIPDFGAK